MKVILSTEGFAPARKFSLWREGLVDRFGSLGITRLDDGPFEGVFEVAQVGTLSIQRVTQGAVRNELQSWKGRDVPDTMLVIFKLSGISGTNQEDRAAIQRPGDLVVLSRRPALLETSVAGRSMVVELPRSRLEGVLGPSTLYTSLTVGADLASTALASSFFQELVRVGSQLSSDAAERMSAIGIDLIAASLAERMAKDVPRPQHGTIVVQRAKAYIKAHLGDPTMEPPQLAAAMGLSLRRLQELFHERGQHISDYIWQRRLEVAALRLADPACLNVPIGTLAYDCGFVSQAHFSRRFKDRHGLSPR